MFLKDLKIFNETDMNGSMHIMNGDSSSEHSRTLKLGDGKKAITLLAPSVSECSLWVRRITEARRQFDENEKSRLLRQRSSKYRASFVLFTIRKLWPVKRKLSTLDKAISYTRALFLSRNCESSSHEFKRNKKSLCFSVAK